MSATYKLDITLRSHGEPIMQWWQSGSGDDTEARQIFDGGIELVRKWIALHPPPHPTNDGSETKTEDRRDG